MNRVERQRIRLQQLIDEAGSHEKLAGRVGSAASYISQLLTARNGIHRNFCIRLERAMNKPDGWMDQWLPEETDPDILRTMFEQALDAMRPPNGSTSIKEGSPLPPQDSPPK